MPNLSSNIKQLRSRPDLFQSFDGFSHRMTGKDPDESAIAWYSPVVSESYQLDKYSSSFGWHFHVRLNGPKLDDTDRKVLEELRPIGVQLSGHNISSEKSYGDWVKDLGALLDDVYRRTAREKLFISVDHEGGRIHRFPDPITHFPPAIQYADCAKDVAQAMALELRSLGINLNFAPCCDVNSNPENPVIGARSFGSSPEEVANATEQFMAGSLSAEVLCCAKHFPGHGDTDTDSHLSLPTLSFTVDALRERELIPFARAVAARIPMVMTAHILFPDIDPRYPATLSHDVIRQLLREELKFDGVVITDDLDMKAVADHFSGDEIALLAPQAGCDILLFNHDPIRALSVAERMYQLIDEQQLDESIFTESFNRIDEALTLLPERRVPMTLEGDLFEKHRKLCAEIIA